MCAIGTAGCRLLQQVDIPWVRSDIEIDICIRADLLMELNGYTDHHQAYEDTWANRYAVWRRAVSDGRLAPEYWPRLSPDFQINFDDQVFTIGSCFVREIENHLRNTGIRVLTNAAMELNDAFDADSKGGTWLNKFTPPSMYQEVEWGFRVQQDGGVVTPENTAKFFYVNADGLVLDQGLNSTQVTNFEFALQRRQKFYDLVYSKAMECDVVIFTLGYIESWLDTETGVYPSRAPGHPKDYDGSRYKFKQLTFSECYEFMRKTIELFNSKKPKKFLITVSPIPLQRTFSSDDVLVANSYSKSVLRAVCGQIATEFDNVDYFPSFENATLSARDSVWADDQMHVASDFVKKIVGCCYENYIK